MPSSDEEGLAQRRTRILVRGRLALMARSGQSRNRRPDHASAELSFLCRFRADQSLGHLAESVGIPRFEVGSALIDGAAWPLELPPPDDSSVLLLPLPEPIALDSEPRFVLDLHLGVLSRMLRLLGFDTAWKNERETADLIGTALAEDRIVLTRKRALLFMRELHASPNRAMLILSPDPYAQLLEVSRRFGLADRCRPFSRCAACGALLRRVSPEEIRPLVPAIVARRYADFFLCEACGKAYWKGDHFRNLGPFMERLYGDLGLGRGD
ncbi:MAG TPA: Mut7-C RNAse domain-containing protein [Rectinemataceae bacterium]|nr:Mut7-C RNAse domain-containing protein [Rectinemataceae bacterium]